MKVRVLKESHNGYYIGKVGSTIILDERQFRNLSRKGLVDNGELTEQKKEHTKEKVNSFNTEFGYELIASLPYAYKLFQQGRLSETESGIDTSPLYFFSPNHIENTKQRNWRNHKFAHAIPNIKIHRPDLDWQYFSPPPLKDRYKNGRFVYDKPIVCICNRINKEWEREVINYFDINCLTKMFGMLKDKYQIVYFNIHGKEEYYDGIVPIDINDYDLARKHGVIVIHDLAEKNPDLSFNELQLMVMANSEAFITMNGGYCILASYMGGTNIIYSKQTSEIKPEVNSFYRWYHKFGGARIVHENNYESLYARVQDLLIDKSPLINIFIRTHNRPNYFKCCYDSIMNQTYKNVRIIVSADNEESWNYLIPYKVIPVRVEKEKNIEPKPVTQTSAYGKIFPMNLYWNEMKQYVTKGWCLFLDDDDALMDETTLQKIVEQIKTEDDLLLWKVKFGERIIPNGNFGKTPIVQDISGIGFMAHSKYIRHETFEPYRREDFRTISRLYKKLKVKWIDEIYTYLQDGKCGMGNGIDKKINTFAL